MAASELLLSNGATPATPASGKTKFFIDSTKKPSTVDDAGLVSLLVGGNTQYQATPSDPGATASTTGLMMGLTGTITPTLTGRILIMISGDVQNNTISDGAKMQIRYGTGTAPTNGAALTGTAVGGLVNFLAAAAAQRVPIALQAVVTGLSIATAYWIDVGLAAVTGGTAAVKNVSISVVEI